MAGPGNANPLPAPEGVVARACAAAGRASGSGPPPIPDPVEVVRGDPAAHTAPRLGPLPHQGTDAAAARRQ